MSITEIITHIENEITQSKNTIKAFNYDLSSTIVTGNLASIDALEELKTLITQTN